MRQTDSQAPQLTHVCSTLKECFPRPDQLAMVPMGQNMHQLLPLTRPRPMAEVELADKIGLSKRGAAFVLSKLKREKKL